MTGNSALLTPESILPKNLLSYPFKVIYCYTAPRSLDHTGKIKVGQTTFNSHSPNPSDEEIRNAAQERILEQNSTGGLATVLQWAEGFMMGDDQPNGHITDYQVHNVLMRNRYGRVNWSEVYSDDETIAVPTGREWFEATPEQAHTALESVKRNIKSMPFEKPSQGGIVLRTEQERFVNHTLKAMLNGADKYLWNAKMRFGKTLTAYKLIEASQDTPMPVRKALIITHRPTVREGWFEDFSLVFGGTDWKFGSKEAGASWEELEANDNPYVYFLSIQDLRGKSAGEFKETNKGAFSTDFDMLIIDEAHEGVETELAQEVSDNISRKFTLNLSGTPYRYISNDAFTANEMSSWDYVQEQETKNNWDDADGPNPYEKLAKMWLYTIDISQQTKLSFENYEDDSFFDFNQFFETTGNGFTHERKIKGFLDSIHNDDSDTMPFGNHFRESNRHSLWVLPSVKACEALKKMLSTNEFYKDYTILNVAGDDAKETKNPVQAVKKAIGSKDNKGHETKTITLTVGRLTTGTTVPEWTSVLFLRNTNSAEFYMQTIFRAQSPWVNALGQIKTDVMVWDFAPDRALRVFTQVSGMSEKAGEQLGLDKREQLNRFLSYLPILAKIDGQDVKKIDANDVMIQLKRAYAERVTRSGFESNDLIIKDFTALPADIREALEEIRQVSGKNGPELNKKVDYDITISDNDLSKKPSDELDKEENGLVSVPKDEQTEEEKENLKALKEEQKIRDTMRGLLKSISVRIPIMVLALMSDEEYKRDVLTTSGFNLTDFTEKIDDESWAEFFQSITKEHFLKVVPAFDTEVLQVSIQKWVRDIEDALDFKDEDVNEYYSRISTILKRLRNPNKETVLTPLHTAQLVYEAAGFNEDGEKWSTLRTNRRPQKFYDINVKSGVFPLIAAVNIMRHKREDLGNWDNVCNSMIFANSRTLAGKWITCAVLGMPKDWANISVIDVHELWEELDTHKLSDTSKTYVVKRVLSDSISGSDTMEADKKDWIERGRMADKLRKQIAKNPEETERLEEELQSVLGADDRPFDYVVSNPPYQMAQQGENTRNISIWPEFLMSAVETGKNVSLINPARWIKGGAGTGLTGIREWIMSNHRLVKYYTMKDTDAFPEASIMGGVCIEVFQEGNREGNLNIGSWNTETTWSESEYKEYEGVDIALPAKDSEIVSSVYSYGLVKVEKSIWSAGDAVHTKQESSVRKGSKEYRFSTSRMYNDTDYFRETPQGIENEIEVFFLRSHSDPYKKTGKIGTRYLPFEECVETGPTRERIKSYQVVIPKTHGKNLYRRLMPIAHPYKTYAYSWLCKSFESEKESMNYESYMKTYLYRYLVSLRITSQHAYANVHRFVPDLEGVTNPRTGKVGYESDWKDDDLREIFKDKLSDDDWRYIKAEAIKADNGKGDYEAGWTFPDGSSYHSLSL